MDWKTIKIVIGREYSTRVKKKSFLITTFVVPVLFAAICILPTLLMRNIKEKTQEVAVIDRSGIVMPYLVSDESAVFTEMSRANPDSVKTKLADLGIDVLVSISPLDSASKSVSVQTYSRKPVGVEFLSSLRDKVNEAVEQYRIRTYGISDLSRIMKEVRSNVEIMEYTMDDSGKETVSESGVYMLLSMILGMMIYMFIAIFGGAVMSSVIEEKSSRVVEVLISSVRSIDLMFGKIIGVALVALTQFLLWIVLTVAIIAAVGAFTGMGELMQEAAADPSMTQMSGIDVQGMTEHSTAQTIVSTLASIPWGKLILCFVIYFILGYLLYASLFAAIGSAVENEADTQQLQLPLTIPLMLAFFVVFFAFKNPDSSLVFWFSMIPFTSPIVMLARIPYGVATWELVVSIVVLALTFVLCAWIGARIYRAGILSFGKKSTFKDLWKWLRQ